MLDFINRVKIKNAISTPCAFSYWVNTVNHGCEWLSQADKEFCSKHVC